MNEPVTPHPDSDTLFGHIDLQSPESVDYRLEIAGIGARSHAFVIDWHIRLLLALAWLIGGGFLISWGKSFDFDYLKNLPAVLTWVWLGMAAIIFFLYHPILEIAMSGRTPGKRMAGVRLVTQTGHTPGTGAILVRNVFRLLDSLPGFYGIGLICVALTRQQVRIGDLAAGLILVYDKQVNDKALRRATHLALNSSLSPGDQSLLLELLDRWPQLNDEARNRLGMQFLRRIGRESSETSSSDSKAMLIRLKKLAGV